MTRGMIFKGEQWACEHGSDDYFYVAYKDGESFSKDERVAAEYIIAASPELLEAAQSAYDALIAEGMYEHATKLETAIAKALGEQK